MKNPAESRHPGIGCSAGPLPARTGGRRRALTPARAEVFDRLVGTGRVCTVADLASLTGQHQNTVREHLDALVEAGFADRERGPVRGRGRPAWLYRGRPQEILAGGAGEYSGLAKALAGQILRSDCDPRTQGLSAGRPWGTELAGTGPAPVPPAEARHRLVELFDDLGFAPCSAAPVDPAPRPPAGTTTVRLTRCPMLDVARKHPDVVCWVHLGVAQGFLEALGCDADGTGIRPFAEPGACLLDLPR